MTFLKDKKNIRRNVILLSVVASSCTFFYGSKHMRDSVKATNYSANKKQNDRVGLYAIPSSDRLFINGVITPNKTETFQYESKYGVIRDVKVESGEYVEKGEYLFSYKDLDVEKEISAKEKEISDTQKNVKELEKNATDNRQQIVYLNSKIKELQENIVTLKGNMTTKVYAPFAGEIHLSSISDNSVDETEVTVMLDSKECYLESEITEQDLSKIKETMPASVYLFSTKETKSGTISYISNRPEAASFEDKKVNLSRYKVKITFESQNGLVNGYHAQARIDISSKDIKIPTSSIFEENDKKYVYVYESGVAKKREISAKFEDSDVMAIVDSGLSENEVIIENVIEAKIKEGDSLDYSFDESVSFD